jgi:hypothetical protein
MDMNSVIGLYADMLGKFRRAPCCSRSSTKPANSPTNTCSSLPMWAKPCSLGYGCCARQVSLPLYALAHGTKVQSGEALRQKFPQIVWLLEQDDAIGFGNMEYGEQQRH